jgi:hypothetical protein
MQATPGSRNKGRKWKDVQLILSSISVALTLGLWGLWASRARAGEIKASATEAPTDSSPAAAAEAPPMLPGQVIYLAGATLQPTPEPVVVSQPDNSKHRRGDKGGGGGGGGGGQASTGSS